MISSISSGGRRGFIEPDALVVDRVEEDEVVEA